MYISQKHELTEFLKQFDCLSFDDGVGFEDGFKDGEAMVVSDVRFTAILQQEFHTIQTAFQHCYKENCSSLRPRRVDVCT